DHRVEAAVVEGQVLGRGLDHRWVPRRRSLSCEPLAKQLRHVRVGFRQHELGDRARVVLEVAARARPELEDAAGGRAEQAVAQIAEAATLRPGGHAVVIAREEGVIGHGHMIFFSVPDCMPGAKLKEHSYPGQLTRRGEVMATFVMLTNLTSEGVQTL